MHGNLFQKWHAHLFEIKLLIKFWENFYKDEKNRTEIRTILNLGWPIQRKQPKGELTVKPIFKNVLAQMISSIVEII